MASATDIANLALTIIGEPAISSIDDENTAGRTCRRILPLLRDELLRLHDWNFARKQAELAASATEPTFRWSNAFPLPADYLCLRSTEDDDDPAGTVEWEIQGRSILTDEAAPLYITYTRRITDPGQFDAAFTTALAARMAIDLALPLTDSAQRTARAENAFNRAIAAARGSSFRERMTQEALPSWIAARY